MKNQLIRFIAASALALCLTACPETYVADDFGSAKVKLKPADWEGS